MMRRWLRTADGSPAGAYGLASILLAFVLSLTACTSGGSDDSTAPLPVANATQSASLAATPFYAEFRTRPYFSITHTFIVYGAQDASGHPLESKTIGFYPHCGAWGRFIGKVGIAREVGQDDYYRQLPS